MRATLINTAERSAWTFVQAFLSTIVASAAFTGAVNWREVALSAAVAGGLAVLKSAGVSVTQLSAALTVAERVPAVKTVVDHVATAPAVREVVAEVKAVEPTPVAAPAAPVPPAA
jgi:hypothetical protein